MNLFKNQKGFSDVITVAILTGIIGSIFIGGVFVWKEVERYNYLNSIYNKISKVVDVEKDDKVENDYVEDTYDDKVLILKDQKVFYYDLISEELNQLTPDNYKVLSFNIYLPTTDNIFLLKDNNIYLFDISNLIVKETSILELMDEGDVFESVDSIMLSQDKSEALIKIGVYDKNSEVYHNEMMGPMPVNTKEIKYNILEDTWEDSNILATASSIIDNDSIFFRRWDSKGSRVFGHRAGEGIGNAVPVYIVDLKNKTFQKTSDYSDDNGMRPFFSSSLNKFILVSRKDNSLLLFDSNDLTEPKKIIDIKNIINQHCEHYKSLYQWEVSCSNNITSISWSFDEEQIAIGFNTQIYAIDLNTENAVLRFSDKTIGGSYMYWERNTLLYSVSGKYLFFVDYDNLHQEDRGTLLKDENNRFKLTAVDLNSNKVSILQDLKKSIRIISGK